MANLAAIRSVGNSLVEYLDRSFRAAAFPPGVTKPTITFRLVSSGGMQEQADPDNLAALVAVFLYHVSEDPHLRGSGRLARRDVTPPLSIDLHYLFTFWSKSAENEQLALAWTMLQLQSVPLLDATILSPEAGWTAEEIVQLIPQELSNQDVMRIWESLDPGYRLSLGYVARVVRIDAVPGDDALPVTATRFRYAMPEALP